MMVIPCLCLSRFSSCTATTKKYPDQRSGGIFLGRHSYALGTLTESDGWCLYGLRLLIFPQPLGRALKNQNAAPASAPCFRRRRRSPPLLFESCTVHHKKNPQTKWSASFLVDIPSRWEPRAKQSRTVALLTALCAAALFESCTVHHKKIPRPNGLGIVVEHCPQHSNLKPLHG